MDESMLMKISLAGIALSLIAILAFVSSIQPVTMDIADISAGSIGKTVSLKGTITGMFTSEGNAFFTLDDGTGEVRVVIWRDSMKKAALKGADMEAIEENNTISLTGEVASYEGALEITAREFSSDQH